MAKDANDGNTGFLDEEAKSAYWELGIPDFLRAMGCRISNEPPDALNRSRTLGWGHWAAVAESL